MGVTTGNRLPAVCGHMHLKIARRWIIRITEHPYRDAFSQRRVDGCPPPPLFSCLSSWLEKSIHCCLTHGKQPPTHFGIDL
jgi:hypothetical protein